MSKLYFFNCDGFDIQIISASEKKARQNLKGKIGNAFNGAILADVDEFIGDEE